MAVLLSLLLVGAALAFTGFLIAVLANLPIRRRMLEMMVVGLDSAGASFLVGRVASTFSVIVA